MAQLTVQSITAPTVGGTALTFNSASGSSNDTFVNKGRTYLIAKNSHASAQSVTVDVTKTHPGSLAVPDLTFSVAAGTQEIQGPFDQALYGTSTTIKSVGSSVTLALITVV